ncbi:uncharacterized protein LOC108669230 [Hyalella azteca]|uniref:Uncharacterized protein LOC108669230 n=1 Tax=Hyalella azteca TaxID=294128 RepID=A0A8B7NEI4_HYAAZ|nr:uncharacterized protein LOC108669230 [Hyalella azteca]
MRRFLIVLLASLLTLSCCAATQAVVDEEAIKETIDRGAANKLEVPLNLPDLGSVEEPWLPYLPLIIGTDTISLVLTRISILGLSGITLEPVTPNRPFPDGARTSLYFSTPSITLYSGQYIGGGSIEKLPFVGESTANITIKGFSANISFEFDGILPFCPIANTTSYALTGDAYFVNFAGLNPGLPDSGYFINTMLSSFGEDIMEWLNIEINPGGELHDIVDGLVVKIIGSIVPGCPSGAEYDEGQEISLDDISREMDLGDLLQVLTQALSDSASSEFVNTLTEASSKLSLNFQKFGMV